MAAVINPTGGQSAGNVTSITPVVPATTAGSTLIIAIAFGSASGSNANPGGGWVLDKSGPNTNGPLVEVWRLNNAGAGITSLGTWGNAGSNGIAWAYIEVTGLGTAPTLDTNNQQTNSSAATTAFTTTAPASAGTDDLWVAVMGENGGAANTITSPGNGYTVGPKGGPPSPVATNNAQALMMYETSPPAATLATATGTITSHAFNALVLAYIATGGAAPDAGYRPPVIIPNRGVGPQVQRFLFRKTSGPFTFAPPPPPPDPGYLAPIKIANENVGPMALRKIFKRPYLPTIFTGPPIGLWLAQKQQTITALLTPYTAQNGTWTEFDIGWYDINGGIKIGYMPPYGGGVFSSWYELDGSGNEIGQNNDNLATTRPDGIIHLATVEAAFFTGTEEGVFATPTEQAPVGTTFRRGLQIRVPIAGADTNKFDWTVTDYLYPGDPFFRIVRIDQHNTAIAPLDVTNAFEFAQVAGLNNNASEWPSASTGYGTVGGSVTTPVPQVQTAGEPDYFYANPGGSAGKILGIVGIKKTAIVDSNYTNVNFQLNANVTPRTKIYYQADVTSVPAGTTNTRRVVTAFKRNMTQAQAVSISADVKTPDAAITNIALGTFTNFSDDEGLYIFNSNTGNSLQFQHSISGNVTKRWLCIYKVTNWTGTDEGVIKIGSTVLTRNVDYLFFVDSTNHILYFKLMGGIVTSGAGANEWNNGIIALAPAGSNNVLATISDTLGAISDSVVRSSQSFNRTISDSLGSIGDSILRQSQSFIRTISDTISTPSDSIIRGSQAFTLTISDTLGALSDSISRSSQSFTRTLSDSLGAITDSVARSPQAFIRTVSDTLNALSDSITRNAQSFLRTMSDSLGAITDSIASSFSSGGSHVFVTMSDTLGAISDSIVRSSQSFNRNISDTIGAISDSITRAATTRIRTLADTLSTPSDSIIRNAQTFARNISDSLGAISDSIIRSSQSFIRTASDTLSSISDTVTSRVTLLRTLSDALGAISDTVTAQRGVARTMSDTLGAITDTVARSSQSVNRTISDSLNAISDSVNRTAQSFLRTLADNLGALSDSITAQRGVARTMSDTLGAISDTVTRAIKLTRPISDTLNPITDSTARSPQSFTRTIADNLGSIFDSIVQGIGSLIYYDDRQAITTSRDGVGQVYSPDGDITRSRDGKGEIH